MTVQPSEATRKSAFAPIVAPDTRLLILGSLPGEASLVAGRYYAHPQNQFWRLAGRAIGRELAGLDYDVRLEALRSAGIGLWDTVGSARRIGSLDGAIRDAAPNDLVALIGTLPTLRAVAFNGATASRLGRRTLGETELALIDLPSSSPANARLSFAAKAEIWGRLRDYLNSDLA